MIELKIKREQTVARFLICKIQRIVVSFTVIKNNKNAQVFRRELTVLF